MKNYINNSIRKYVISITKNGLILYYDFNNNNVYPDIINVWSITSNLNQSRDNLAGCGTVNDALCFGGDSGNIVATTEIWNGSSWSTTSSLNENKRNLAGCGTVNDALCFGGYSSNITGTTEIWNGSSWAITTSMNIYRESLAGCGTVNDALCFGGYSSNITGTTEIWNGSSWAITTSMNIYRESLAGCGTNLGALSIAGKTNNEVSDVEKWYNISSSGWVTTSPLNITRTFLWGCGTIDDTLSFGGYTGANLSTTEIWNGSTWATTTNLNAVKRNIAGCGTTSGALCFGGYTTSQTNATEIWNGSSWATTSNLNQAVYANAGCGSVSAGFSFGGSGALFSTVSEIFKNISASLWTTTSSLNLARMSLAACGTTSDALSFGGGTTAKVNNTEIWNGSSWATTSNLNIARLYLGGCGTTSDALAFGGWTGAVVATTEKWNGSSWATSSVLNQSKYCVSGCGTTTDSLCFGGYSTSVLSTTEIWNGSSWSTTSNLNRARYLLAGCGTTSDTLSFGGGTIAVVATTEKWNGSSWATTSNLNQARYTLAGCGSTLNALSFGGFTLSRVNTTEKWNGSLWTTTYGLNITRSHLSGCGITSGALSIGGYTGAGTGLNTTEKFGNATIDAWSITSGLNQSRYVLSGCGTTTDSLCFGGYSTSVLSTTEIWNGSSWSTTSNLNQKTYGAGGCGTITDALAFGGASSLSVVISTSQKWNGSSWNTVSSLNQARYGLGGCGTANDALAFGGGITSYVNTSERWNGLQIYGWTTVSSLNQSKYNLSSCGTVSSALCFGGYSVSRLVTTEKWDGSVWATISNLSIFRDKLAGCGNTTDALAFGGNTGNYSNLTEKYYSTYGLYDKSGSNLIGGLCNNVITGLEGKLRESFDFDGTSGYLDCNNNDILNITGDITIECWIKMMANPSGLFGDIVNKGSDSQWTIYLNNNGSVLYFDIFVNGSLTSHQIDFDFSDKNWHHIICTYGSGSKKIYIDTIEKLNISLVGSIGISPENLTIGGRKQNYLRNFNGLIDNIRIYDRSLSFNEIIQNYSSMRRVYISPVSGYEYKMELTIDHTKIESNLIDFPVLVKLNSSNFDFTKSLSNGYDIRFTDISLNLLFFERERHDSLNQLGEYWVKISNISSSIDTKFIMYFGNKSSYDGSSPHNVWDSNFKMVQHLQEDFPTEATAYDSTIYANNGGASSGVSSADCEIGKGIYLPGTDGLGYIEVPDSSSLTTNPYAITIESWVNFDTQPQLVGGRIVEKGWTGGKTFGCIAYTAGDPPYYGHRFNTLVIIDGIQRYGDDSNQQTGVDPNTWNYCVATCDGASIKLFINGLLKTISAYWTPGAITEYNYPIRIGKEVSADGRYAGLIDEVRISNVIRSDAWIKATYYSESNNLLTFGPEINI
jgi:hypothetical protein